DDKRFEQNRRAMEANKWAFAAVTPRGIGPTRWNETGADGKPTGVHIKRRFALIGRTLDDCRVWDVRPGLAVLRTVPDLQGAPRWGGREGGGGGAPPLRRLVRGGRGAPRPAPPAGVAPRGADLPARPRGMRHATGGGAGVPEEGDALRQGRRGSQGVGMATAIAEIAGTGVPQDPQGGELTYGRQTDPGAPGVPGPRGHCRRGGRAAAVPQEVERVVRRGGGEADRRQHPVVPVRPRRLAPKYGHHRRPVPRRGQGPEAHL